MDIFSLRARTTRSYAAIWRTNEGTKLRGDEAASLHGNGTG